MAKVFQPEVLLEKMPAGLTGPTPDEIMVKTVSVLLSVILVVGVIFPEGVQAQATLPGDANGDCLVSGADYAIWLAHYQQSTGNGFRDGDFNGDSTVTGVDYAIWLTNYRRTCTGPTPTPGGPTATRTPTPSRTPTPGGPTPTPTPSIGAGSGIWISPEEIARFPITGQAGCDSLCTSAWNAIINSADSSWGSPNLSTYAGLGHSQGIWAGAIASARLASEPGRQADAQRYRDKVIKGLNDVIGTEEAALPTSGGGIDDGSLAEGRQFLRYVTSADLLGITNWSQGYKGYRNYVDYMFNVKFTFRRGDGGSRTCDHTGASNGGNMNRATCIAMAVYLGDKAQQDRSWLAYRRFTGDYSAGFPIDFSGSGDAWYHDTNNKLGLNPKGATCNGSYPADGVLPNDQGRGGGCPSNSGSAPGYTQYPWEGIQGLYAQALILYRLGYAHNGQNPWQINDNALLRAVQYQWSLQSKFGGSWYDSGRAAWVKHLAYKFYGFKPIQYNSSDGGRNMSHTQWLNQ